MADWPAPGAIEPTPSVKPSHSVGRAPWFIVTVRTIDDKSSGGATRNRSAPGGTPCPGG
jgi:hypothetical protein